MLNQVTRKDRLVEDEGRTSDARLIEEMSVKELVQLIQNASLPFLHESDLRRLPTLDRENLERLVYLAQQYSRQNGEHV